MRRRAHGRPTAPLLIVLVQAARPARVSRSARVRRPSRTREDSSVGVLCHGVRRSDARDDTRAQIPGQDLDRARSGPPVRSRRTVRVRDAARRRRARSAPRGQIQGKGVQPERASGCASCALHRRPGAKGTRQDATHTTAGRITEATAPRHCRRHISRSRNERRTSTDPAP